jgi:hypothetical protein
MITHDTAVEIIRLDRIERRADAYLKRALESGNRLRARRAARLLTVAHNRAAVIVMGEVRPYTD